MSNELRQRLRVTQHPVVLEALRKATVDGLSGEDTWTVVANDLLGALENEVRKVKKLIELEESNG